MENILKIIKQVESTHRGLGVPTVFNILTILARKGIFNIASRGNGKGTIISSIHQFDNNQDYQVSRWDNMTLTELVERIGSIYDTVLIWKIPEWSTLQKYHRELLLSIGSQVITDGNFYKIMFDKNEIDIKECSLVLMVGIQPMKLQRLMIESETWESLSTDRFTKFVLINPLRSVDDYTKEVPKYTLPDCMFNNTESIKFNTDCKLTSVLFSNQVSKGRSKMFSIDYLTAYALLDGISNVTIQTEIEFYQLFHPYLELYSALSYSWDIDKPDTLSVGAFRLLENIIEYDNGATAKELASKFHVYKTRKDSVDTDTVTYHMRILLDRNIVENSLVSGVPQYRLSKRFRDYFDYYKDNWCK